jgi:hypothetical protein
MIIWLLKQAIRLLAELAPTTAVKLHTQDDTILNRQDYGVSWVSDGRKFFYFHDYMGWHNLSEGHRSDACDDPAYCPWHGSL